QKPPVSVYTPSPSLPALGWPSVPPNESLALALNVAPPTAITCHVRSYVALLCAKALPARPLTGCTDNRLRHRQNAPSRRVKRFIGAFPFRNVVAAMWQLALAGR